MYAFTLLSDLLHETHLFVLFDLMKEQSDIGLHFFPFHYFSFWACSNKCIGPDKHKVTYKCAYICSQNSKPLKS